MAALLNPPLVPLDEYLNSSYSPDREYVDGVLVERSVGTIPHSRLQRILLLHFDRYTGLGIEALPECRTRTTSSRFRVPDVMVVDTPFDVEARYYDGVPLVVIEILSPDDKMPEVLERFEEYQALGVLSIVQMDPVKRITRVFEASNLIRKELRMLDKRDRPIPFDTVELYSRLD
jgi:Uma2 family endonuclease